MKMYGIDKRIENTVTLEPLHIVHDFVKEIKKQYVVLRYFYYPRIPVLEAVSYHWN